MTPPFHLVQFLMPPASHHSLVTWRHPRNLPTRGVFELGGSEAWELVGRLCEAGTFDAVFLAGAQGVYDDWQGDPAPALRYGVQAPVFSTVELISFIAAATNRLGLVATLDTTGHYPYAVARQFATLDHLSRGRAGWNVVTGFHGASFRNLGLDEPIEHDERYERAEEFMEVCYGLWDSWEPDAIVRDVARDMFADPAKVHEINYRGRWYSSRGPLNVSRSPQGHPLIVSAGSSERGKDFAAKHAELIFAGASGPKAARAYYEDVKTRMVDRFGRRPEECKIVFLIQPWPGETESIAREKAAYHDEMANAEAGLTFMSATAGVDFAPYAQDLDASADVLREGYDDPRRQGLGSGRVRAARPAAAETGTVRDRALATARGPMHVTGTGAQIADWMEAAMAEIGGDGFILSPAYIPGSIEEFVSLVIPELRRRGLVQADYVGRTFRDHLLAF